MSAWLHSLLAAPAVNSGGGNGGGDKGAPWFFWVIGPALVVIGLVSAVRPDLVWRANRWQYKNRDALEPSAAGLLAQRAGGVIMVAGGIFFMVLAATK